MYQNKRISLVIPAYNEEEGLESVLRQKPALVDEVIVVDNNSTDNTRRVAEKHGAVVVFLEKRGYGQAYQAGLARVSGDIIIMMDADNSYPASACEDLLAHMERNSLDFLTGCRFPLPQKEHMPLLNRMSNRLFSWLLRKLFSVRLTDSQSGMFCVRRDVLKGILPSCGGMEFSQILKLNAWSDTSIRCGERHIHYQDRIGKVKYRPVRDSVRIIGLTLKFLAFKGHLKKRIAS